ncbi:MAG TPA: PorV/PorQ family protein [Candidatus Krumholzibacteria bacterium]|nr:PorV/PorQ family protein [Candidatus Krumholzibacteria bacterium]HRX50659.1 PorV/PorQ family protein [Candidatus Krumholzibacteria bacterium]
MFRKTLPLILAACALTVFAAPAMAVSGAGAIALEFPVGARYNALGEAGTALSQDVTSMWWNPGGLAFATGNGKASKRAHVMQSKLVPDLADDIAIYWAGYATESFGGTLGLNLTYLAMGSQEATNDAGEVIGTFDSNSWAFGLNYGTRITPNLGVGMGVKYFRDNLAPDEFTQDQTGGQGSTFAVDMGLLWKVPSLKSNIGVAISNLGPNITHVDADQSDPLPRKMTVGIARSLYQSELMSVLFVGDMLVPLLDWNTDADDYGIGLDFGENEFGVGVEWSYDSSLFVQFGYKKGTGDIEDSTYGFGLDLEKWVGSAITFGFASVPQAKGLERVTRFSLGYDF